MLQTNYSRILECFMSQMRQDSSYRKIIFYSHMRQFSVAYADISNMLLHFAYAFSAYMRDVTCYFFSILICRKSADLICICNCFYLQNACMCISKYDICGNYTLYIMLLKCSLALKFFFSVSPANCGTSTSVRACSCLKSRTYVKAVVVVIFIK